jgi:hypothetical protein
LVGLLKEGHDVLEAEAESRRNSVSAVRDESAAFYCGIRGGSKKAGKVNVRPGGLMIRSGFREAGKVSV